MSRFFSAPARLPLWLSSLPLLLAGGCVDQGAAKGEPSDTVTVDAETVAIGPYGSGGVQVRVDDDGRIHAAWAHRLSGTVFYGRCDEDCGDEASWRSTEVTTAPFAFDTSDTVQPWLELTPGGDPRLGLVFQDFLQEGPTVVYAECDGDCTDGAAWVGTQLYRANHQAFGSTVLNGRSFALSPEGAPRFFVDATHNTGDWETPHRAEGHLLACEADCAAPGSWTSSEVYSIEDPDFGSFAATASLVVDSAGRTSIALRDPDLGSLDDTLLLFQCTADCGGPDAQWTGGAISDPGFTTDELVLRAGPDGALHLAVSGAFAGGATDVAYSTCGADCTEAGSWTSRRVGEAVGAEGDLGSTVDLHVDDRGTVHLAFFADQDPTVSQLEGWSLGSTASCDADCAGAGEWTLAVVDDVRQHPLPDPPYGDICLEFGWGAQGTVSSVHSRGDTVAYAYSADMPWGCSAELGEVYDPSTDEWVSESAAEIFSYYLGFVSVRQ